MNKRNPVLLVVEKEGAGLFAQIEKMNSHGFELHHTDYENAAKVFGRLRPAMVIVHTTDEQSKKNNWLQFAPTENPKTYWVLSAGEIKPNELVDYMRFGVRDYIDFPFKNEEFEALMDRYETWSFQSKHPVESTLHQTISFFSSKGGVGQSSLAVNFSVELARRISGRVLLIDYVLQHGNVAEMLDLPTHYALLDLIDDLDRIDHQLIENTLVRHESGLFVLPCPRNPEDSEVIGAKQTEQLLKVLSPLFHTIVLDVGHELTPPVMACLDQSDSVFALTTGDLSSLCNTRGSLETFRKLGYERDKVKLILNRNGMKGSIPESQVIHNLDYPVYAKVGEDSELVLKSINQGLPWRKLVKKAALIDHIQVWIEKVLTQAKSPQEAVHESA